MSSLGRLARRPKYDNSYDFLIAQCILGALQGAQTELVKCAISDYVIDNNPYTAIILTGRLARRPTLIFLLWAPCKAPKNNETFVRVILLFTVIT